MFARISTVVLVGFLFVALSGVFQAAAAQTEENKAIVQRLSDEVWNQGNLAVADEIFATDFVNHDPSRPDVTDLESYKGWVVEIRTAIPDYHLSVFDVVAEGDKVVKRWTATGIQQGVLMGIPPAGTGDQGTTTGISAYRLAGGKIVEQWWSYDVLGMLQQMGVASTERTDFTWGAPSAVTGDPGDPEANKAIVRRYLEEAWNQQNLDVLDELMTADVINHSPTRYQLDLETHKQVLSMYFTGLPDLHGTTEDLIAEGDKVVGRYTATGTHQGELIVPATGNQVVWTGINVFRFADGKIVETWWAFDSLGIMQQIGVIPPLGPTAVESRTWGQVKALFK